MLLSLKIILAYILGFSPIGSYQGFRYYISLIDHFSHHTWTYILKLKNDTLNAFSKFKTLIENLIPHKTKYFQSDGGSEFMRHKF